MRLKMLIPLGVVLLLLIPSAAASAHVKWFADFAFTDRPLPLQDAITPTVIALTLLSMAGVGVLVFVDRRLDAIPGYQRISQWLADRRALSTLALRIGAGITLLLSWQADALLVPELPITSAFVGWMQFVLALLLIFPFTVPVAGVGIIGLWVIGVVDYGLFYMMDYLVFIGVGVFLIVSQAREVRVRALGVPALYFTLGFSLAWLGVEKLIYPEWGLYILQQNPQLALGFPFRFFLTGAAFVEITLGYLLIIGLMGRPLSLVVTLVFFGTTLVFGKTEVIGHTILHAALIVFLLEGPGHFYPAPIDIHRKLNWRVAFAAVNFLLVLAVFLVPYALGARATYTDAMAETLTADTVQTCQTDPAAEVVLSDGNTVACAEVLAYVEEADSPLAAGG
ncbi:MAG: hypothetical protein OHK0046_52270 [Anaerolineae bacterium]